MERSREMEMDDLASLRYRETGHRETRQTDKERQAIERQAIERQDRPGHR